MKRWLCLGMLALLASGAHAQKITHEDLWLMPRVDAPLASPDGRLAVFSVTEPAYEKDKSVSDLWLVATDGKTPARRLTNDKAAEGGVAWSADSTRIAFAAKRGDDKQAQIHVLDLARGGEAQRATTLSTGASAAQFSPDGAQLLFVSRVFPQSRSDEDSKRLAKEHEERKYKARVYDGFPIRYWDKWLDEKHERLFVQELGKGEARDLLAGSTLAGLPGFSLMEGSARWAPDGRSIVFAASRNRDRAAWSFTHADLWQVDLSGGEPRRLTGVDALDAGDSFGNPQFSPDGRHLLAVVTPRTERVYNARRLAVFSWPAMQEKARVELPDARAVASFAISPDSRTIYVTGEEDGQEKLYRASMGSNSAQLVAAPERGTWSQLSMGGKRTPVLLASHESATQPAEIVRLDVGGKQPQRLTSFTVDKAAALDLPPLEHFWFDNDRGQRIHNMLVRPAGFDPSRSYPLLVLMHGGPHSQWRDQWVLRWNYHLLAQPGFVVLLTNYVGSTNSGEAFAQAIQGDPLKSPADDINQAADEAIKRYAFIDGERQCAGGASYGGHLANWLQGTSTRYRCLVSHAGLVNLESQWGTSDVIFSREVNNGGPVWEQGETWVEQNPIRLIANYRTPVLVTIGEKDYRVPLNNTLEYWSALQRQQVESRLLVFPEENHWILSGENSRFFYNEVSNWLSRWLLPAEES